MTSNMMLVTGNTYPVKEQIKALGGRWDAVNKGWKVPQDKLLAAQALVAGAGPKSPWSGGKSYSRRSHNDDGESWRNNGCSACRRAGTWCRSCAFDEFDN